MLGSRQVHRHPYNGTSWKYSRDRGKNGNKKLTLVFFFSFSSFFLTYVNCWPAASRLVKTLSRGLGRFEWNQVPLILSRTIFLDIWSQAYLSAKREIELDSTEQRCQIISPDRARHIKRKILPLFSQLLWAIHKSVEKIVFESIFSTESATHKPIAICIFGKDVTYFHWQFSYNDKFKFYCYIALK